MPFFFARRGPPHLVIFDNGNSFTASDKELPSFFYQPSLQDFFGLREVRWIFKPTKASHFGGVWERLIHFCIDAFTPIWAARLY